MKNPLVVVIGISMYNTRGNDDLPATVNDDALMRNLWYVCSNLFLCILIRFIC